MQDGVISGGGDDGVAREGLLAVLRESRMSGLSASSLRRLIGCDFCLWPRQDLIHQVRRAQKSGSSVGSARTVPTSPPSSWGVSSGEAAKDSLSLASFEAVLKSFEAKKK
jgi:hypothetical protein